MEYCENALQIRHTIDDRPGEANSLNDIGVIYFELGDTKRALEYFEQALPILRDVGYRAGEATALFNLGSVAEKSGEILAAIGLVAQAVAIDEAIQSPELASRRAHLEALSSARHEC